jgi:hypothetical protein
MNLENANRETIENHAVEYLLQMGFFNHKLCNNNKKPCFNVKRALKRRRTAYAVLSIINWRCPRCQTFNTLNEGTFFEQFKLPVFEILSIIKCWSLELTICKTIDYLRMDNTAICRQAIAKIFKAIRMVCSVALNKKEIRLGGENLTVQIDESLFAKVKHHVGKDLARKQVWVFGMVDVKFDLIYFQCVPDRTASTLLSIIYEHVVPDTTVNSDCWPSYKKISLLHQSKLKHQTVNHKYNFVDPTSSTHTNKIESKWCVA